MTSRAKISIDVERVIGEISPLLFGGFAEHMGRCIYGGIYEPGSPHADERGLRRDVLAALRELEYSVMRYPGGNFVSGYNWLDGVGPKALRPRQRELAWQSIETNQFGIDEFMAFCAEIGTQPMLGLNFGTGSILEAANLVEYCNASVGTRWADLRATNGHREPYGVKYWCLGNEMDGPWQIGHLNAEAYATKAREAAKLIKWHDPSVELITCGSSGPAMATFPEWDRVVLESCWDQVDYLSLHCYVGNKDDDLGSYLGLTRNFEAQVDTLAGLLRYVKGKLRSKHDVYLSWDEWNVWYKDMTLQGGWSEAPHLVEDVYNLADALVVALWMNVFLRRCDVLKIACVAQIVNVLGSILTTSDTLVKQTIFYPFRLFRQHARGQALDVAVSAPAYASKQHSDLALIDVAASYDAAGEGYAVFVVNRSQEEMLPVTLVWQNGAPERVTAIHQLSGTDAKTANTFEHPEAIVPIVLGGCPVIEGEVSLVLPPLSFTVVVAGKKN